MMIHPPPSIRAPIIPPDNGGTNGTTAPTGSGGGGSGKKKDKDKKKVKEDEDPEFIQVRWLFFKWGVCGCVCIGVCGWVDVCVCGFFKCLAEEEVQQMAHPPPGR